MYTGNSVIVNLFMRWPVLVPIAAAAGIYTAVLTPATPSLPLPPVAVEVPPPSVIVPPVAKVTPPVESLCPPPAQLTKKETAKLTAEQRKALKAKGCIRG